MPTSNAKSPVVSRQIAFFAAFILPIYKLVEMPSVLSRFAEGDLLLPAILQYVLQAALLIALLYAASVSEKPLLIRLQETFGKWTVVFYLVYAVFFLFTAALPLLDAEKLVYAVFYDTAPTLFSFAAFFLFSAFVCVKGLKTLARSADLCLFLFVIPFLSLIVMSLFEADATNLLPIFEHKFGRTASAIRYTTPYFLDVLMLLPLIGNLEYKKGDGVKISLGYALGAGFVFLFLGVFYSLYSTIAPREHYAFTKIAQYFPALSIIGRVDLLFVYMLCIVLFFSVSTPLFYSVELIANSLGTKRKTLISALVNGAAFIFTLFFNQYYNSIYALFCEKLTVVFWIFAYLPPLLFLLYAWKGKPKTTKGEKNPSAQKQKSTTEKSKPTSKPMTNKTSKKREDFYATGS